jgi:hypothetical protein
MQARPPATAAAPITSAQDDPAATAVTSMRKRRIASLPSPAFAATGTQPAGHRSQIIVGARPAMRQPAGDTGQPITLKQSAHWAETTAFQMIS